MTDDKIKNLIQLLDNILAILDYKDKLNEDKLKLMLYVLKMKLKENMNGENI